MSNESKELKQGLMAIGLGLAIVAVLFFFMWPDNGNTLGGAATQEQAENTGSGIPNDLEGTPYWLNYDGKYQLYYDDKKIDRTNRVLVENDLLVYDPLGARNFLFVNFVNMGDSTLRKAREFERGPIPLWRVKDGRFWLYVEGEQITDVTTFKSKDDLVATDKATGVRYRMRNFYILNDNRLRLAQPI